MAATSAPFGFRPVYHPSGQIRPNYYNPGAKAGAAAIYRGDPVKLVEDGTDWITIAGTTDAIIGIFAGCEYIDVTGKPNESSFWPGVVTGATNIVFYVYDDPQIVYEAQSNGSIASSAVGDNAPSVAPGTGSTATGLSAAQISSTLSGSGSSSQWRIVGLGKGTDNAWGDAYTNVQCMIAKHQYVATLNAI